MKKSRQLPKVEPLGADEVRALLAPILRASESFDAAGNADGTALCVCEAYFVARSISVQLSSALSAAISGAAPSKSVSKALK